MNRPPPSPQRIVSLVPSLTESLFELGLGSRVVGVTDWCVHPAREVAELARVGGTKNPSLSRVLELRPDLVIANREENRERDVAKLRAAGLAVWVTYPRTVSEAVELLAELAALGAPAERAEPAIERARRALELARARRPQRGLRTFCPIWKRPWMAVGADTYAHDLIELCGGLNVFADRDERRYPIVETEEIVAARPDVILLPDEPYSFGPARRRGAGRAGPSGRPQWANSLRGRDARVLVWIPHGPRLGGAGPPAGLAGLSGGPGGWIAGFTGPVGVRRPRGGSQLARGWGCALSRFSVQALRVGCRYAAHCRALLRPRDLPER